MARISLGDIPLRQQILLFAIALAGGGYLFYSWSLQPLRETASGLDSDIQSLQRQIDQARLVEAQLPQFRADVARQEERLRQFRATLPSQKETPELMRSVQRLAADSNLNIKSFTPQKTVQRDFYVDWPIEILLEGNYHNLATFFQRVGELPRLVNIGEVSIRGIEASASRDRTISASCTATTFVYLEDQAEAGQGQAQGGSR